MVDLQRLSLDIQAWVMVMPLLGKSIESHYLGWKAPSLQGLNQEPEVQRGKVTHKGSEASGLQSSGPSTTRDASAGRRFQG